MITKIIPYDIFSAIVKGFGDPPNLGAKKDFVKELCVKNVTFAKISRSDVL